MRLIFGILLVVLGLWFLGGVIRMLPVGTYHRRFLRPSTWGDVVRGLFLSAAGIGVGIFLIVGS